MITKSSLGAQLLLHSPQFSVLLSDGPDFNCQMHCDWYCWRREVLWDSDSVCSYEVAVSYITCNISFVLSSGKSEVFF
jgi:hypothetical protein